MKLVFNSIKIENFMSIGNAHISLKDMGFTLISGINNNVQDSAASNGSGKSSIFEAIVWCMTGDTIRGNKDVVNFHGSDGALVQLDFTVDGKSYVLIRTKDHSKFKTNLKIIVDNIDVSGKGIRDSEKILKEYLPDLTSSLIGSVIVLGQGMPSRFTNNSPSGRKEVLEKLCKSDFMIDDLKDRLSSRKSNLQTRLREFEDLILTIQTKKDVAIQSIESAKKQLEDILNEGNYDELIETNQKKLNDIEQDISFILDHINNLKNKINNYDDAIKTHKQDESAKIEATKKSFEPLFEKINDEINDLSTTLKAKYLEFKRIADIKETCPTCGQRLPDVVKPDTSNLELEIRKLENDLNVLKSDKSKQEMQLRDSILKIQNDTSSMIQDFENSLKSLYHDMDNLDSNLTKFQDESTRLKNTINELTIKKSNRDSKIAYCTELIEKCNNELQSFDNQLIVTESNRQDIDNRLNIISKFNTVITRDFRGYLLSSIIEYVNMIAKEYCMDIFNTSLISFFLEGNNLTITYDNKPYEALSGGEKQKIDLIIQFSIRDMLCKYTGFSTNILVLDEIFDSIDICGCNKIINLIGSKLTDISSVFIVTHRPDLQIPYDNQITVIKDSKGVSSLK